MRKTLLICLFTAALAGVTMSSCSNDDEPEKVICPIETTTFSDANGLILTYSGQSMLGKQVVFTPNGTDGSKATLVLSGAAVNMPVSMSRADAGTAIPAPGVIPGETTTTLEVNLVVEGDKVTFEGIDEKDGCKITYKGEATSGEMKLDLQVVMPQNALTETTWKLAENATDPISPFHVVWDTEHEIQMGEILKLAIQMAPIEGMTMPQALRSVLQSVTFQPDGNIQAQYKNKVTDTEWAESPKNLAMYTVDESKQQIRVFLNVSQIMAAASKANTKAGIQDVLPQLMSQLTTLLSQGIPVSYATQEDGTTAFYVDTELILPLLKMVAPLTENAELKAQLIELVKANAGELGGLAAAFVSQILDNFTDIVDKTSKVQLGIKMVKA